MATDDLTKLMEELTGVPPVAPPRRLTREERKAQKLRLAKFLALPEPLQKGALAYAEQIRKSYEERSSSD